MGPCLTLSAAKFLPLQREISVAEEGRQHMSKEILAILR